MDYDYSETFYQKYLTEQEKQISHLYPFHDKVKQAEQKVIESQDSDWTRRKAAYRAALTKAEKRLGKEIRKHLGDASTDDMKGIAIYERLQNLR
jgi:phosphoenolpyruvate carboxylase